MKIFITYRDAAKMKGLQIRTFRKRYVDTGLISPIAFHVPGGKKNHLLFLRVNVEKLK